MIVMIKLLVGSILLLPLCIKELLAKSGFHYIFLVDNGTSDILSSAFKEIDFATNLRVGPLRRVNLVGFLRL